MSHSLERFRWSTAAEQRRCLLELIQHAMNRTSHVTSAQIHRLLDFPETKEVEEAILSELEYGERISLSEQLLALYPDLQLWPPHDSVLLPNVLWLIIFEFVGFGESFYNVRHTCRFLFKLSADPGIWKRVRTMTLPIPYCLEARDQCVWLSRACNIRSLTCQSDFLAKLRKLNPELQLRSVQQLNFQDHSRLVDSDLIQCLRICGRALKRLDLSKCESISDTGIRAIGELCSNLEHLQLDGCQLLTDAIFHRLPQTLNHISINRCSQITDIGVYSFCSSPSSNSVKHLDINLCSRITEQGLLAISNSCPNLTSLLIAEAGATPAAISAFSQNCNSLEKIDISFGMADRQSLFSLIQGCPQLYHIIAVRTKGIDLALAADIRTFFPEVRLELYHEDLIPMSRALIQWR